MNLYWPVYQNLERQLVELAEVIHFNDSQENVYSIHIADLLIRTAVEIEALSKHLYEKNGGSMEPVDEDGQARQLFFDTDCIQFLDIKWKITKKVVNVVGTNFYFEKMENRVLRPLKNCNKQGEGRWKKAYQAVKHDRVASLPKGNIGNLIRAMAALYLLNLYNMEVKIEELNVGDDFNSSLYSEVFSVNTYKATSLSMNKNMSDSNIIVFHKLPDDSAYTREATVLIDKYSDQSFIEMHRSFLKDELITAKNAQRSKELREFLEEHPKYKERSLTEQCIACGEELEKIRLGITEIDENTSEEDKELIIQAGINMLRKIESYFHSSIREKVKREIVLNTMQQIYPELGNV